MDMSSFSIAPRMAVAAVIAGVPVVSAGQAPAQCEPDVAWRVEVPGLLELEPALGPDGEAAVQGGELVVVERDGTVRFRRQFDQSQNPLRTDIGPDGTIYAISRDGPVALDRDGNELWRATLPGGVSIHRPVAGPTVGPDGNIYYAGETEIGFASLTPEGDLRWRVMPFGPRRSTNLNEVLFFEGRAIFADCCLPLGPGVVALDTASGDTEWFTPLTGTQRAAQMSNGDIVTGERPPNYTRLDPASGGIIPIALPFQATTSTDVAPGPDGIGYSIGSLENVLRIPRAGDIEVVGRMPFGATAGAALTPDAGTLVLGLAEDVLPSQAYIAGVDPESAALRWSIPLPQEEGQFLRVSAEPSITDDGARAYVPVLAGTLARGNVSYLYAVDLCGGPAPCPADFNGDGEVSRVDFLFFRFFFRSGDARADLDGDGEFTAADVAAFRDAFTSGC
jgi:hypothetical protein